MGLLELEVDSDDDEACWEGAPPGEGGIGTPASPNPEEYCNDCPRLLALLFVFGNA